jgi:4-alpha-glucanotransferase
MTDGAGDAALSPLARLSERVGIISRYLDQTGREWRETTDETRRDLLAALGIDASTDAAATSALDALDREERDVRLAPVRVVEESESQRLWINLGDIEAMWRVDVETEQGNTLTVLGVERSTGHREVSLSEPLPPGYHRARLLIGIDGIETVYEQTLIVVPARAVIPQALVGTRAFGLTANLYSIRSSTNWGAGDFSDLGALAEWGAAVGADFVGVNPLHALTNRGSDVSPYSPVSRLFRNPLYIDVLRVPELEQAPEIRERITSPEFRAELDALRATSDVRYDQVIGVKGLALTALHRVFYEHVRNGRTPRARAYADYVERRKTKLTRFAQWMAIAEAQAHAGGVGSGYDWRQWPDELRDPASPAVQAFAATHEARVDFHQWIQFEADRQLAEAATRARTAGMRIGLYQDLAIGSSPAGADTWAFPELFVRGASIGAPPDPYAPGGQNWGLPPIDPRALHRSGYRYFIDLVRAGLRHAGALRIDHVMGLFRLFWIPAGKSGKDGAYVKYPAQDLLGIIALESLRHNALIVGEDLGTVPEDVPPALEKWGVLSSRVMYFERDNGGAFKPAEQYPTLSLATANTHDLATITGFWNERDIDLRRHVGLIASDEEERAARDERGRDRHALLDRLAAERVLLHGAETMSHADLRGAVHAFLCQTPAALVGLALDDLAGEIEPVNVPGVGADQHPSWTRKMRDSLETIATSPDVNTALRSAGRARGTP